MSDAVPDGWPPTPSGPPVPMFPLPGVFLFPRSLLPLQVFEPRYVQMVEECLDGPGKIVMATVLAGEQESPEHVPRVLQIGGLGEIARHDRASDGRFLLWVFGRGRVELEEVECDTPYRQVRTSFLATLEPSQEVVSGLLPRLRQAILTRVKPGKALPQELPLELLIDLLGQRLNAPPEVMEELFAERDMARRAELTLAADKRFPGGEQ
jgi:Lon protease-like protein